MKLDRNSSAAAEEVFYRLAAKATPADRNSILRVLRSTAETLHRIDKNRWGVTLFSDCIRFNAGLVECFVLFDDAVRVLVELNKITERLLDLNGGYKNAEGCASGTIAFDRFAEIWPKIRVYYFRALQIAANRVPMASIKTAHSPGVVEFLGRSLFNPDYYLRSQKTLHVLMGGFGNRDKRFLDDTGFRTGSAKAWTVPKSCLPGDDFFMFIAGEGLYAAGTIATAPQKNSEDVYRASLANLKKVAPPITLDVLRARLPGWGWLKFTRQYTTPTPLMASKIRAIVLERDDAGSNAEAAANPLEYVERTVVLPVRDAKVKDKILNRAGGRCEGCLKPGPFADTRGRLYLEAHHVKALSDKGPDHVNNALALCPTCHKRAHYSLDRVSFEKELQRRLKTAATRR